MKRIIVLTVAVAAILANSAFFNTCRAGENQNREFVKALYKDLQGREGDPTGVNYWVDNMNKGMSKREVAKKFLSSKEYSRKIVTKYYGWFFDRKPDQGGLKHYAEMVQKNNWTEREILIEFCVSEEFWNKSGKNPKGYITRLYQKLQSRQPDSKGLDYWSNQLKNGKSRRAIVKGITGSGEYRKSFVNFMYDWYLGRKPDAGGMKFFADKMKESSERELVLMIIGSKEYWNKAQK
jgi:hypothetical protein